MKGKPLKRDLPIPELKGDPETEQEQRLNDVLGNPRDKAFINLLKTSAMRISEVTQLNETDIDFKSGTMTIVHLKERSKLKCPHCGEILGKRHNFCPGCGNKVDQAIREKVEHRRQRIIPIHPDTLQSLAEYLKWRRKFPYRGLLVFPFTRQRGWQLVRKLGQRAGIQGLHPHSFRHAFATKWVSKGLDVKKLQVLLGHASIATTMEYVDSSFEQLRTEYHKLWESKGNETTKTEEQ